MNVRNILIMGFEPRSWGFYQNFLSYLKLLLNYFFLNDINSYVSFIKGPSINYVSRNRDKNPTHLNQNRKCKQKKDFIIFHQLENYLILQTINNLCCNCKNKIKNTRLKVKTFKIYKAKNGKKQNFLFNFAFSLNKNLDYEITKNLKLTVKLIRN